MGILDAKSAIVTGGGKGLGRGIALALADEGAAVAVLGRTAATLNEVSEEIISRGGTAIPVVCDVCSAAQITASVGKVVEQFGGVDILVNNAQIIRSGSFLELPDADVEDIFDSGPLATLRLMRACYPYLRGGGSIINLSSVAAYWAGPPTAAIYGAAKAAIGSLTRSAAIEWGPEGIRANVLVPMAEGSAFDQTRISNPEGHAARMRLIPLGRLATEHDVGRAVVFLAGPDAQMITGTVLPVDGGQVHLR